MAEPHPDGLAFIVRQRNLPHRPGFGNGRVGLGKRRFPAHAAVLRQINVKIVGVVARRRVTHPEAQVVVGARRHGHLPPVGQITHRASPGLTRHAAHGIRAIVRSRRVQPPVGDPLAQAQLKALHQRQRRQTIRVVLHLQVVNVPVGGSIRRGINPEPYPKGRLVLPHRQVILLQPPLRLAAVIHRQLGPRCPISR